MTSKNLVLYYKNRWLCSYETLLFDTLDGDLGNNQYAEDDQGTGYYVQPDKNSGNFIHVGLDFKESHGHVVHPITGKELVHVIPGHAYYDEFLTAVGVQNLVTSPMINVRLLAPGSIHRRLSHAIAYKSLAVKNAGQPVRIEQVEKLPPDIPANSSLGQIFSEGHHSIGLDANSGAHVGVTVNSITWAHTCAASANFLIVGDSHYQINDYTTSATYNGDALTMGRSDVRFGTGMYSRSAVLWMVAPDTGAAYNIVVSYTGIVYAGAAGGVSYIGVKQIGQPDAVNGAAGGGMVPAVTVTTIANNCWVFAVLMTYDQYATGATDTTRWGVPSATTYWAVDTNGPQTPAGARNITWTLPGGTNNWAVSGMSFSPSPDIPKSSSMAAKMLSAGAL